MENNTLLTVIIAFKISGLRNLLPHAKVYKIDVTENVSINHINMSIICQFIQLKLGSKTFHHILGIFFVLFSAKILVLTLTAETSTALTIKYCHHLGEKKGGLLFVLEMLKHNLTETQEKHLHCYVLMSNCYYSQAWGRCNWQMIHNVISTAVKEKFQ